MPFAHHDGVDEVALEILAIRVAPVLGRPILIIGRQPRDADDFGLLPFGPRRFPLPMAHRVDPPAHGQAFASGRLRPGIGGHGHIRFGWHYEDNPLLVQPPQIGAIQKALGSGVITVHSMVSSHYD